MRLVKVSNPNEITAKISADSLATEMKFDGFLSQVVYAGGPRIYSRRGKNISPNVPSVVNELVKLDVPEQSMLLGELVWFDEKGKQSIDTINSIAGSSHEKAHQKQEELKGRAAMVLYDVLWLNGKDMTQEPFRERRAILEKLVKGKTSHIVMLSPMRPFDDWEKVAQASLANGGEGVVIKNLDSKYFYADAGESEPKPKGVWWKWKPPEKAQTDDFVVYNAYRTDKGALMVEFGQYLDGKLFHVGKIDSFGAEVEAEMEEMAGQKFVIEMGFEERTADGMLRHPHFMRIRHDKDPKDVDLPPEFAKTLQPAAGSAFESRISRVLGMLRENITIEPSQGDGWKITTPHGFIDYRHVPDSDTNEIWWVESRKKGHGSELVDLMQKRHPAGNIAWGVTSLAGEALMKRWHAAHPEIGCETGAHEGQFDPFGHEEEEEEMED
jgi:ATP-dependent DNA ligase